jgi:TolB protein
MKKFLLVALLFLTKPIYADAPIHLNVGDAKFKKSLVALPNFQYLGTPGINKNVVGAGKEIYDTLQFDLSVSSYFDFLKREAFIEDVSKVGLRPIADEASGFNFASWKQIGADFLIRAGYKIIDNELSLEAYLYYVPQQKKVLAKTYQGKVKDARLIAHTFANDIVKELTGIKGFFLTKIVVSRSTEPQQREIFTMDWDGSNVRAATHHHSIANSPAWSADGKSIGYRNFTFHSADKTRNADLFFYNLQTDERKLISARPGINSGVSFFPDGRHIALTMTRGESPNIYKMTMDGKSFDALTSSRKDVLNVEPSVSPDGNQIAFSSDRNGRPMVYVMNADGTNVKRLTIAGEYNSCPKWSPDGKKIVFAGSDKGHFDLFVMDADGSNMIRLTSAKKVTNGKMSDNEDPSFSPDGRHILFTSNRDGHHQLYIVDVDGENERRISFDKNDYYKPSWSPYLD